MHAFLFFVITSGRPLLVTTFFVFSKPLLDLGIFCTAATALFIAVKGHSTAERQTAKICYCCSQPLYIYSSFVALLEVILLRCGSAAHFVRVVAWKLFFDAFWLSKKRQRAKKVVSDSPGLVDFAIEFCF